MRGVRDGREPPAVRAAADGGDPDRLDLRVCRRGMVLDVETRPAAPLLRASSRRGTSRDIPVALQMLTAAAILEYEMDGGGLCGRFALHSWSTRTSGERAVAGACDRALASLHDAEGTLVVHNGGHDLLAVRFAAMRHRDFGAGGAARWWRGGRREDTIVELGQGPDRRPKLGDLAAAFGVVAPGMVSAARSPVPPERAKCELDVVVTMVVHLHVLAERAGSRAPLDHGLEELRCMLLARCGSSPHLRAVLESPLLQLGA